MSKQAGRRWSKYSPEFKRTAVDRIVAGESPTAVARELGIRCKFLYAWKAAGKGSQGAPTVSKRVDGDPQEQEVARLQRRIAGRCQQFCVNAVCSPAAWVFQLAMRGMHKGAAALLWGEPVANCGPAILAGQSACSGVGGTLPPRLFPGPGKREWGAPIPCCRRLISSDCHALQPRRACSIRSGQRIVN